jgi:hypothetical protein
MTAWLPSTSSRTRRRPPPPRTAWLRPPPPPRTARLRPPPSPRTARLRRPRGQAGQTSLELLAGLPLAAAVVMVAFQLLAAGASRELAGNAAGAGAAALLQGLDPRQAARDALPGWSRSRMRIEIHGRRVRVRLRPVAVVPGAAGALTATAEADAGTARPGTRPGHTATTVLERTERMRPGAGGDS